MFMSEKIIIKHRGTVHVEEDEIQKVASTLSEYLGFLKKQNDWVGFLYRWEWSRISKRN